MRSSQVSRYGVHKNQILFMAHNLWVYLAVEYMYLAISSAVHVIRWTQNYIWFQSINAIKNKATKVQEENIADYLFFKS